jgi:hypothetical protein
MKEKESKKVSVVVLRAWRKETMMWALIANIIYPSGLNDSRLWRCIRVSMISYNSKLSCQSQFWASAPHIGFAYNSILLFLVLGVHFHRPKLIIVSGME